MADSAAMKPAVSGILSHGLRNIRDVNRLHKSKPYMTEVTDQKYKWLVELIVLERLLM
jgi:hypothetical protein